MRGSERDGGATDAKDKRGGSDNLRETQRGQEAAQALTQEAVAAYMDFMNSVFPVTGTAGRSTQE